MAAVLREKNIVGGRPVGIKITIPIGVTQSMKTRWESEERQDKINNEIGSPVNAVESR